jgi:hypothetical protein
MSKRGATLTPEEQQLLAAVLVGATADVPPEAQDEVGALVGSIVVKLELGPAVTALFEQAKAMADAAGGEG